MKPRKPLPPLTPEMLSVLRAAKGRAESKHGAGGREKERGQPKPITLRRADYEKERGQ